MPQVKIAEQAQQDLRRFADFLIKNDAPKKASEVASVILDALKILRANPMIGKPYQLVSYENFRELIISYGKSGYVALYSFDSEADLVTVHTIRHQKEVGYTHK